MMNAARTTSWVIAAAAIVAVTDARADELILVDGSTITCEGIKDATCQKVTFKLGASNQERAAQDVERIIPSGDQSLDTALRLLKDGGDAGRIESNLKRALERAEAQFKPYAQYFLGEHYENQGKVAEAIAEYEKVAALKADHFYAPVGLYRAAQLLVAQNKAQDAQARLAKLASGDFGPAWKDKGAYMQARLQLKAGQKDQAKQGFAKLAGSAATPALRHLAAVGEGMCELLANQTEPAKRKFQGVVSARDATTEARGWALKGLGDCLKASAPDEALLAYLRSFLLYPSNPEAGAAAAGAAEVANAQRVEGGQRLAALGRGRVSWGDFSGPMPDAELMRRAMQNVSAALVRRLAPQLAAKASGEEKAELEFLANDALKAIATSTKDAKLMEEFEANLKALQQKYPNHGRAQLAGIDGFIASKDRALTLIAAANDEADAAKKQELLAQGRKLFADNLEPFKATIAQLSKEADEWTEKEMNAEGGQLKGEEAEKKTESEFRRDLAEFLLAEAYYSYATTFPEGDKGRAENLKKALDGYEHQINNRGQFQRLLNYAYVGRVDIQIELGQIDEAISNARELTDVEPPFIPDDPEAKKEVIDGAVEMCIRAHIALIKALLKANKGPEAIEVAQGIDQKRYGKGWKDHPMGVLFSFERAKAYAGGGQGARGAQELWGVIQKAMQAPEAERIPGLGMSKVGAGACRALSEMSDVSGGEIYPPAMQYHVGVGYFLRSRPELAIAAFKGVLVAARTPAERREWVPKAVRQIGNLLFEQQRFLEAALAYETVMTEFPDLESEAGEAIKYSLSAAKRAVTQFGEDPTNTRTPIVALYKRIESSAAKLSGDVATTAFMREAADLQTNERWVEAAEKYMAVPQEVEKDGKKVKVELYPNAIANAGYCYFQGFKKGGSKDQALLTKAREQLTRAVQLARDAKDLEAQSLAAFYLGELECDLERPTEALAALAPFDAELRATTRYMVRARYQQAQAYLMMKPLPADALDKAEEAYRKVADKKTDPKFASFAYFMARTVKAQAASLLKTSPDQLDAARALRRKAAQYGKDFFESTNKETMREAHYFWVGGVLFDGGMYADAVAVYREALGKFKRPAPDGSEPATRAQGDFDTAELNLGYALVAAGQHRQGYDALAGLRSTVDIRDRDGRLVGRAKFKTREQLGPFKVKYQGKTVEQKVWFTVLELNGQDVKFFDTANPAAGDSEFTGVQGDDPTKTWSPAEQRKLTLPLKREYLVVDGMCRAAWGLYEQSKDKNFLANELSAAINELRYVLRGMSDTYYRALAGSTQLEPTDFTLRTWDADLQYLRLKMAREAWREVVSDIKQMEMLGKLDPKACPPAVLEQINAIKKDAEAKQ